MNPPFLPRLASLTLVALLGLVIGCAQAPADESLSPTVTPLAPGSIGVAAPAAAEPIGPVSPTQIALTSASASAPPAQNSISLSTAIQGALRSNIQTWAQANGWTLAPDGANANLVVSTKQQNGSVLLTEQVYAVADWFPTLRTGISFATVKSLWQGQPTSDGLGIVLVDAQSAGLLSQVLGPAAATVQTTKPEEIIPRLWTEPSAIAIVPFDQLAPKETALPLDGQNVLSRDLALAKYPLVVRVWVSGNPSAANHMVNGLRAQIPATTRDPERMTTLIMTGVTAMARFTAFVIDQHQDPAYPARVVAGVLSKADITHISNEIPFVDNCPRNLDTSSIILCSKPSYIAAMKLVGTDIVGLTGNHAFDFGVDNYIKTLDLYDQAGMRYYAGGRTAAEAARVLIVQDHGNKLAFLGANSFGPSSYWAKGDQPGTQGYDPAAIKKEVAEGRQKADVVFAEFQSDETYDYAPDATNETIFRRTQADGADVVTGVQAHHPQAVEFSKDGRQLILYGLGNFWFDQMYNEGVRQGLVPRHTIYQGRLIQTELLTTMLENSAQPRWATPAEREKILSAVFDASGFVASK